MTIARSAQISLDDTPYYHCITRCVRRAFLCGFDKVDKKNYEHRRALIEERLFQLSEIFSIDICSYAIMSNHYHIVVHINRDNISTLDDKEIVQRWQQLYSVPLLVNKYIVNDSDTGSDTTSDADAMAAKDIVAEYRERLYSLSWFMKCLNEFVSRLFNKEDNWKGPKKNIDDGRQGLNAKHCWTSRPY